MKTKGMKYIYAILIGLSLYILFCFKENIHFAGILAFFLTIGFFHLGDKVFKIDYKKKHYAILVFMSTFGLLFSPLYNMYIHYDKILHLTFPFLGCILIFYIVNKTKLDIKTKLILTFTTMITLITFSEIVEYYLDQLFNLHLQGVFEGDLVGLMKTSSGELITIESPLSDTITDLSLGVLGSLIFVVSKLWIFKNNKKI